MPKKECDAWETQRLEEIDRELELALKEHAKYGKVLLKLANARKRNVGYRPLEKMFNSEANETLMHYCVDKLCSLMPTPRTPFTGGN